MGGNLGIESVPGSVSLAFVVSVCGTHVGCAGGYPLVQKLEVTFRPRGGERFGGNHR